MDIKEWSKLTQKVEKLNFKLQQELQLHVHPRAAWSLFPEWKEKIETWEGKEAHLQKIYAFLKALSKSTPMKIKVFHQTYMNIITDYKASLHRALEYQAVLEERARSLTTENMNIVAFSNYEGWNDLENELRYPETEEDKELKKNVTND